MTHVQTLIEMGSLDRFAKKVIGCAPIKLRVIHDGSPLLWVNPCHRTADVPIRRHGRCAESLLGDALRLLMLITPLLCPMLLLHLRQSGKASEWSSAPNRGAGETEHGLACFFRCHGMGWDEPRWWPCFGPCLTSMNKCRTKPIGTRRRQTATELSDGFSLRDVGTCL